MSFYSLRVHQIDHSNHKWLDHVFAMRQYSQSSGESLYQGCTCDIKQSLCNSNFYSGSNYQILTDNLLFPFHCPYPKTTPCPDLNLNEHRCYNPHAVPEHFPFLQHLVSHILELKASRTVVVAFLARVLHAFGFAKIFVVLVAVVAHKVFVLAVVCIVYVSFWLWTFRNGKV